MRPTLVIDELAPNKMNKKMQKMLQHYQKKLNKYNNILGDIKSKTSVEYIDD